MKESVKNTLKGIATAVLAVFAGWSFRFGGSANGQRWVRQAGIGTAVILAITVLTWHFSWWYILIMGLAFTESTYFKKKGTEAMWYHWLLCGICYALVPLPALIAGKVYLAGFIIRFIVLVPIITIWRTFQGNVQWSEGGAGAWQIVTLPLLLIQHFWFL